MTFVSKKILTERVRRLLSSGFPSTSDRVQNAEITLAIGSVANTLMKGVMFTDVVNADGESIPPGVMIATYPGNPVQRGPGNKSTIALPAQPVNIIERQGVFSVYPSNSVAPELEEFLPLPPGTLGFWKEQKLINPLSYITYTAEQRTVVVDYDLIGAGITQVDMKLCIFDISSYDDNEPLPITPDQEMQIIDAVVEMYSQEPRDRRSESNQPQPEK